MVKQDFLMESLSSNLHGFLNQNKGNLSVPGKNFYGMVHWSGSIRPSYRTPFKNSANTQNYRITACLPIS